MHGENTVEGLDYDLVDSGLLKPREFVGQAQNTRRVLVRLQDSTRMRLEGVDDGLESEALSSLPVFLDEGLVPEVDTVKIANGQHTWAALILVGVGIDS